MSEETTNITSNQSAEKVMLVLEALARQQQPVKLGELAQEMKMNASTLYRFLVALQNTGYVLQHKENGKYELNLKLCYLSDLIKSHFSITSVLHPFVEETSALFQEFAHLGQLERGKLVYVDYADTQTEHSQSLMIRPHIGRIAQMHCTSIGKLFLSEYDEQQLDEFIARDGLPSRTSNTLSTKESLVKDLDTIRSYGYALDNEECEIGVRCIAVPIRDYTGKIVAGLSVSAPTTRITSERISSTLPAFLNIAERASSELNYFEAHR